MDLNDNVRPGYKYIVAEMTARAGGKTNEELLEFYKKMPSMSPVCDSVRNPVHVTFGLVHNGNAVSSKSSSENTATSTAVVQPGR